MKRTRPGDGNDRKGKAVRWDVTTTSSRPPRSLRRRANDRGKHGGRNTGAGATRNSGQNGPAAVVQHTDDEKDQIDRSARELDSTGRMLSPEEWNMKRLWACHHCSVEQGSRDALQDHVILTHLRQPFWCCWECGWKGSCESSYAAHRRAHLTCPYCFEVYAVSKDELDNHKECCAVRTAIRVYPTTTE